MLNLVPRHEDVQVSGGTPPRITKPRHQMEDRGQPHATAALPRGMSLRQQLDRKLGGGGDRAGLDAVTGGGGQIFNLRITDVIMEHLFKLRDDGQHDK
jgi:hypothetical protein